MDLDLKASAEFDASFKAVMGGTASIAQAAEAVAVAHALGAYLREASLRAQALPARRAAFLDTLSDENRAAALAALVEPDSGPPRLLLDKATGTVDTPDGFAARDKAEDEAKAAAQKAIDDAVAADEAEKARIVRENAEAAATRDAQAATERAAAEGKAKAEKEADRAALAEAVAAAVKAALAK